MSDVFAKKFGRMDSCSSVLVSSVKYSSNSAAPLRQVKYVYDCENPTFARYRITFGRVNASDRKIVSGWRRCTSAIHHSQKRNGLVCGLSTRKIFTPCETQKRKTSRSAAQSARQSGLSKSNGYMS